MRSDKTLHKCFIKIQNFKPYSWGIITVVAGKSSLTF